MQDLIHHHLSRLAAERDIKILFACETGSRAWGFPSPDSDYDVRLIYLHRPEWYLSLAEKKDHIDIMLEDRDLDFAGWDLRKTLRLLMKSNGGLLERIQSPIHYQMDPVFMKDLEPLADAFYSRIATMWHYLGMAKNMVNQIDPNASYKLKTLFYALRTASVCRWILEREEKPPIEFKTVLDGIEIGDELHADIERLLVIKSGASEGHLHTGEQRIISFIQSNLEEAREHANELPAGRGDVEALDQFFLATLERVWK